MTPPNILPNNITTVAIIGHGHVGRALYERIKALPGYRILGVAVKHPEKHKDTLPDALIFSQGDFLIEHPEVEVILEAIDDAEAAAKFAEKALVQGKTYISASKKMLASRLAHLHGLEQQYGGKLLYEAAVGGAIPILRTLREHLRGEPVKRIRGILNGTCNYILSRMHEGDISFDVALKEAQELGFAESDPSSDVDAHDSYYKSLILAYTAQGGNPALSRVVYEGIRQVSSSDVKAALAIGKRIKLIAEILPVGEKWQLDIRPQLIGVDDPLYAIERELNAIAVEGQYSGTLTFCGAGAGGVPTASAMVADLLNAPQGALRQLRQAVSALGM